MYYCIASSLIMWEYDHDIVNIYLQFFLMTLSVQLLRDVRHHVQGLHSQME